jgi:hypothetical protein
MAACPYLTGLWTFRCLARSNFVIPTITEETRYCLSKNPERCPHYMSIKGGDDKNYLVTKSKPTRKST